MYIKLRYAVNNFMQVETAKIVNEINSGKGGFTCVDNRGNMYKLGQADNLAITNHILATYSGTLAYKLLVDIYDSKFKLDKKEGIIYTDYLEDTFKLLFFNDLKKIEEHSDLEVTKRFGDDFVILPIYFTKTDSLSLAVADNSKHIHTITTILDDEVSNHLSYLEAIFISESSLPLDGGKNRIVNIKCVDFIGELNLNVGLYQDNEGSLFTKIAHFSVDLKEEEQTSNSKVLNFSDFRKGES